MPTKRAHSLTKKYKQQNGLHHSHNNRYLKVYWPYLPILLVIFGGIASSIIILVNRPGNASASSVTISNNSLLNASNQLRQSNNVQSLSINGQLNAAAQAKAEDMVQKNYWAPVSPTGQTPLELIKSYGYNYQAASENLAYGFTNTKSIVNAWLLSAQQRNNELSANYSNVGFGIAYSNNYLNQGPQTIIVAMYGMPVNVKTLTLISSSPTLTSASLINPKAVAVSRIETLAGNNGLIAVLVTGVVAGGALAILFLRHGLLIKKWLSEGESIIIKHPYLDMILILVVITGAVLSQRVGFIH